MEVKYIAFHLINSSIALFCAIMAVMLFLNKGDWLFAGTYVSDPRSIDEKKIRRWMAVMMLILSINFTLITIAYEKEMHWLSAVNIAILIIISLVYTIMFYFTRFFRKKE